LGQQTLAGRSCERPWSTSDLDHGVANPVSGPDCGELSPLSVNVIVPVLLTPRAALLLVNLTDTVHDAPGASVTPVQLSGPASAPLLNKNCPGLPPDALMFVTTICAPPAAAVLAKVTNPVPVLTPLGSVIVGAEIETPERVATLVPVRFTTVGASVPAVVEATVSVRA
jgi:hypothetical protein